MRPIASLCKWAVTAAVLAILTCAGSAWAQPFGGDQLRSSPKVVKQFRPVIAKTTECTVRVQCDGKDACLGAVIGPDGWIITKASELKGTIVCRLKDGKEYAAKIVGVQVDYDLAMLKIEATGLKTIEWRNSKDARVGDWVASVALTDEPVAIGVISVGTRAFKVGDQPSKLNLVDSGYLGVGLADDMGAAKVTQVEKGTPADKAGLKVDDRVTRINDKAVLGAESMIDMINKYKPGDEVTLKVQRGDAAPMDVKATLIKRPAKLAGNPQEFMGSKLSNRRGGFPTILQHDTVIKPTDCGGPLVDLDGKVVGINIARAGRSESYAIPSEAVRELLLPLMSGMLPPRIAGTEKDGKAAPTARGDSLAPGNWKISSLSGNGTLEITSWVLKLDAADGKTTATLASANPGFKNAQLKSFTVKDATVRAVLSYSVNNFVSEQVFDGKLAGKDGNKVVGTLGTENFPSPAWMVPTDVTELEKTNMQKPAGDAGAGIAALFKIRVAKKEAVDADLAQWAETAARDAATYGPGWELYVHSTIATTLVKFPSQAPLAVKYAELAANALPATATPAKQITVLETLARAQRAAGKDAAAREVMGKVAKIAEAAEKALPATAAPAARISALETLARAQEGSGNRPAAKETMEKVAKLDRDLDAEYITTGLPFKTEPFAGRKGDSKRVVVLELFTGAQCPPCVAADLAFDGLVQTYKSADVVLLQYHVHIPGPDPLTNRETEARWKKYGEAFKVGGVPTAIVNGKTPKVGGGPLAFAGQTYTGYRKMIDPLLEMPAGCELTATARRVGDKIEIQANVAGLANPGAVKLRLVLCEESVHYGGGNKIRIHHHVVRAMPGGADGLAIAAGAGAAQLTASVDLPELRKTLTGYLDDFVATKGPFPRYIRPMEMRDLRVVALVQDDETHEILQAVQVGVEP